MKWGCEEWLVTCSGRPLLSDCEAARLEGGQGLHGRVDGRLALKSLAIGDLLAAGARLGRDHRPLMDSPRRARQGVSVALGRDRNAAPVAVDRKSTRLNSSH